HLPPVGNNRRARRAEHRATAGRRARLGHGRHRLHPRARRRAVAAARRRGRARGRRHRRHAKPDRMNVAVVGGGGMGLAAWWALKRRGLEPVVYEQFEVGNPHGSSHGRSRIFRLAYPEEHFVRLAQEALPLWRELEAESGETILELYGLVEIVGSL